MLSSTVAQLASLVLLTIHVVVDVDLSDVLKTRQARPEACEKVSSSECESCAAPVVAISYFSFVTGAVFAVLALSLLSVFHSWLHGSRRSPGGSRSRLIDQSSEGRGSRPDRV